MASLWAYGREDWPGTWLWRPFNALFCCCRMSPTCDLGSIGPRKGWAEEAQGAPRRAPRGAVREGGARGARQGELVALATSSLGIPVRSHSTGQCFARLAAVQWGEDRRERELGHHGAARRAGEEGREGEVEGALKSASIVAACRTWYLWNHNEAVRPSVSTLFSGRRFLDLELPMSIG